MCIVMKYVCIQSISIFENEHTCIVLDKDLMMEWNWNLLKFKIGIEMKHL